MSNNVLVATQGSHKVVGEVVLHSGSHVIRCVGDLSGHRPPVTGYRPAPAVGKQLRYRWVPTAQPFFFYHDLDRRN